MVDRRNLTDRTIKALKPTGKRYEVLDTFVPGMAVRVTEKGERSFVLIARYPGSPNPTRRSLGRYGALTLDAARDKARDWLALIKAGKDPQVEEARQRKAAAVAAKNTFAAVAEDFITAIRSQRKAAVVEREIRKELIPPWGHRPITEIEHDDVVEVIEAIVNRPAKTYAHNVYDHIRSLFSWAIERGKKYGLKTSPCDRVRPSKLIGKKNKRTRVLTDNEIRALWHATDAIGYPFGPLVKALMLTGARLDEVAGARWREFDLPGKKWTVPEQRFKSESPHIVALSDDAVTLFDGLPRWAGGDHLFSTRVGRKPDERSAEKPKEPEGTKPVNGFSKAKERIDKQMGSDVPHWVFHDIRRTVRTRLSALRVPEPIAEMVIGHGKKGLARVYDQHEYWDEMREAMNAWAARLRSIVDPPPGNVVKLRSGAI